MHHTLRTLARATALLAVGALLAASPAPSARAADGDADDVSEMCFHTNGEDAGLHRLDRHVDPRAWVGGTLTGDTHRYWLKFDLTALPVGAGEIESATLTLTAGSKSLLALGVALGEDGWDAATLDWAGQPSFAPAVPGVLQPYAADTQYTWDVTPHVVFDMTGGDRTLSLVLMQTPEGDRSGNVWFHTDLLAPYEHYRPALCIRYREASNTPPEVSVGDPVELWPPNRTMHAFSLADLVSASDAEDGALDPNATGRIVSITCNEDTSAREYGHTARSRRLARQLDDATKHKLFGPDIQIVDDAHFAVRAERDGSGQGRTYTVLFTITDTGGLTAEAEATIVVPMSQGTRR